MQIEELTNIQIQIVDAIFFYKDNLFSDISLCKYITKKNKIGKKDLIIRIHDIYKALEYIQSNNLAFYSIRLNKDKSITIKKTSLPNYLDFEDKRLRQTYEKNKISLTSELISKETTKRKTSKKKPAKKQSKFNKEFEYDALTSNGMTKRYGHIIDLFYQK